MARTDNLNNFLTDVATAIRGKTGETDNILASDFDTQIASIATTSIITVDDEATALTLSAEDPNNLYIWEDLDSASEMGMAEEMI